MGDSGTLESVGQHSMETTEINRRGVDRGPGRPWASATWGTQRGPHPLTCPTSRAPLARLPSAVALTQSTQLADWLKGKDYNVGWAESGWAWKPQSARAGSPSVLVLVFLLVFFNLIILRGCKSLLRGIENANDARDDRAVLTFMFLADQLDVSQFAEIEIPFFLQPIYGQLQVQQLLVEFKNLGISLMATVSG